MFENAILDTLRSDWMLLGFLLGVMAATIIYIYFSYLFIELKKQKKKKKKLIQERDSYKRFYEAKRTR